MDYHSRTPVDSCISKHGSTEVVCEGYYQLVTDSKWHPYGGVVALCFFVHDQFQNKCRPSFFPELGYGGQNTEDVNGAGLLRVDSC